MKVIRDLISGNVTPVPFDIWYNGSLDVDCVTKRYKGSLVKFMDYDDIDHGRFATFAGLTTEMENVCGILEEEAPTSDNYLPDATTYGVRYRKVTPIFPTSVIEAEYSQYDAAGTANVVASGITGTSGASALAATCTTDTLIGGWFYFVTGACAGFLVYVTDNSTSAVTLASALPAAVLTTDDALVICPPNVRLVDFDATFTGLKSSLTDGGNYVVGISTWIDAPGIAKTKLDRELHSGLIITGARFYHQFVIPSYSTKLNAWIGGIYST